MYLLDTNIVLHATRQGSPISAAVEAQFQLSQSAFRPTICEVTIAELWAFAQSWGTRRRELMKRTIDQLLVIRIGREVIHQRWAERTSSSSTVNPPPTKAWTTKLWIDDLRINLHLILKENPLKRADLEAALEHFATIAEDLKR